MTVLILVFGISSFNLLSAGYFLGSNEATFLLPQKPVIIDWEKYEFGFTAPLKSIIGEDTFMSPLNDQGPKVKRDLNSVPSIYLSTSSTLIPLFMQMRTGSLSYLMVRGLAALTNPSLGLILFTWLCAMGAFIVSLSFLRLTSDHLLLYVFLAVSTPQMANYLYSQFPDSHLSFLLILLSLFLLEKASGKTKTYVWIGVILGLSFYVKMASAIFLPSLLLLYYEKIIKNWKNILLGLFPWLILLSLNFDLQRFISILEMKGIGSRSSGFWVETAGYYVLDIFSPQTMVLKFMHLIPPFSETLKDMDKRSLLVLGLFLITSFLLLAKLLSKKDFLKMLILASLHFIAISFISHGLNNDIYDYMAQGLLFVGLITVSRFKFTTLKLRSLTTVGILFFFTLKTLSIVEWSQKYRQLTSDFSRSCVWIYDCVAKDLKNLPQTQKELVTLNYLDVGQLEYFSGNEILPIHVSWKLKRDATSQELLDFLLHFPSSEFYILESQGFDSKSLSDYFLLPDEGLINLFKQKNISANIVRSYTFMRFDKYYRLWHLTRYE